MYHFYVTQEYNSWHKIFLSCFNKNIKKHIINNNCFHNNRYC